ncbi:MAG: threonine aldolase [Clostridiales bacterium]|nr:threonine aldolase [Bacillota bacterium]MEE0516494.1 beta-eliminating lyase-related protein [Anaerovoracaceae bacterium]PWL93989.1 MAG: threonine aldolase [Clostridiales bacterium]
MIYFRSDYSLGAHPKVMDALAATNMEHTDGYSEDRFSFETADIIRDMIGQPDANVHFMVGGTPTNTITIAAALRPYEGVISPSSGHIYVHETGSVEATGHRIFAAPTPDGKLRPEDIEKVLLHHEDEHTVIPKMVYITHPTENGGVYTKAEFEALYKCCQKNGLYLYMDGARLGTALTWPGNDLSLKDIASMCDAFYIGGTKIGALFGEALIIMNENINDHFRYMIKRAGVLLAKGRLIAVQLKALLEGGENSLYYQLSKHENRLAIKLAQGIEDKGYKLWLPHQTNQVFVILPNEKIAELEKDFFFYTWTPFDENSSVIRLVIGWGSTDEDVEAILSAL